MMFYLEQRIRSALARHFDAGSTEFLLPSIEAGVIQRIKEAFPRRFPYESASRFWPYAGDTESDEEDYRAIHSILEEVIQETDTRPEDFVYIVWDIEPQPSLRVSISTLLGNVEHLVAPHHMYIVPEDVSWCICLRANGDAGFGYALTSLT